MKRLRDLSHNKTMRKVETEVDKGYSWMETEPRSQKLYTRLLALCYYVAFGGTAFFAISYILWPPPFSLARPNFNGTLCCALMGLGFILRSFQMYAQGSKSGNQKFPAFSAPVVLLLTGILELCFSGLIFYSNLKVLGY